MHIVKLLQKVGKEIMKKCQEHINVDRVFSGFIISTREKIKESIRYDCFYNDHINNLENNKLQSVFSTSIKGQLRKDWWRCL